MKRNLYNSLLEWKESPRRKPLVLYGARQVGKTWLLKLVTQGQVPVTYREYPKSTTS